MVWSLKCSKSLFQSSSTFECGTQNPVQNQDFEATIIIIYIYTYKYIYMFVPYHDSYVYIYTSFQTFSRFFRSSNEINAWGTSQGLIFQKIFASSRINSWTLQLGANHQTPFSPFLVLWSTFSFPVKHMKTASENSHFYSQNWMGFLSTGNPDIWWDLAHGFRWRFPQQTNPLINCNEWP